MGKTAVEELQDRVDVVEKRLKQLEEALGYLPATSAQVLPSIHVPAIALPSAGHASDHPPPSKRVVALAGMGMEMLTRARIARADRLPAGCISHLLAWANTFELCMCDEWRADASR